MLDLFVRRVAVEDAPSIVPAQSPVLVPGTADDLKRLKESRHKYPLWHAHLSGPRRSRDEEKWYRALVGVVADGIGMQPDTLHFELKYHAGKILQIVNSPLLGLNLILKSSIQMDDEEFHAYVKMAEAIMFTRYLPGVRRADVRRRVFELTGLRPPK